MVGVDNYRTDGYYPKVVRAFDALLAEGQVVAPVDVFMKLGNLHPKKYDDWRFGRVACLEQVIAGNLSKCRKILRLIGFHAHDLSMKPSPTVYNKWGKGRSITLRFTKHGDLKVERAYSKCFVWNRRVSYLEWVQGQAELMVVLGAGESAIEARS